MWYLKNHKTWVTAGKDFKLYEWDIINDNKPGCKVLTKFDDHEENIMDVCEICEPLMIATASIDKTIRIYSLVDRTSIGVRSLILVLIGIEGT
jgi:WD40 repeat protein